MRQSHYETLGGRSHNDGTQYLYTLIREVKDEYPINEAPKEFVEQMNLLIAKAELIENEVEQLIGKYLVFE